MEGDSKNEQPNPSSSFSTLGSTFGGGDELPPGFTNSYLREQQDILAESGVAASLTNQQQGDDSAEEVIEFSPDDVKEAYLDCQNDNDSREEEEEEESQESNKRDERHNMQTLFEEKSIEDDGSAAEDEFFDTLQHEYDEEKGPEDAQRQQQQDESYKNGSVTTHTDTTTTISSSSNENINDHHVVQESAGAIAAVDLVVRESAPSDNGNDDDKLVDEELPSSGGGVESNCCFHNTKKKRPTWLVPVSMTLLICTTVVSVVGIVVLVSGAGGDGDSTKGNTATATTTTTTPAPPTQQPSLRPVAAAGGDTSKTTLAPTPAATKAPPPTNYCGDNQTHGVEVCDGTDWGTLTTGSCDDYSPDFVPGAGTLGDCLDDCSNADTTQCHFILLQERELSLPQEGSHRGTVTIDYNVSFVQFELLYNSGGNGAAAGDADLYVRHGAVPPTLDDFGTCRPWKPRGTNEVCSSTTAAGTVQDNKTWIEAQPGTFHYLIYGYESFANVTFRVLTNGVQAGVTRAPTPAPSTSKPVDDSNNGGGYR